jgi:hypothetical protein
MKIFLLITLLTITHFLNAQIILPDKKLELLMSQSIHGTGDIPGFNFATEYGERFKKRLSWTVGIGGTIHDGSDTLFFNDPDGNTIDGSIRYTTAGVQTTGDIGYSFIRNKHHDFKLKLGALLRYQSSSYYDIVSTYYPAGTGLPFPVVVFQNKTPQKTFAFGGSGHFQYNYSVSNKLVIGVVAGLQTDTNGDTIRQLGFTMGRQF